MTGFICQCSSYTETANPPPELSPALIWRRQKMSSQLDQNLLSAEAVGPFCCCRRQQQRGDKEITKFWGTCFLPSPIILFAVNDSDLCHAWSVLLGSWGKMQHGKTASRCLRRGKRSSTCYRFNLEPFLNGSLNWINTKGFADCTVKYFSLMFPPLTGWALPGAAGLQRGQIFVPGIWSLTCCKGGCP